MNQLIPQINYSAGSRTARESDWIHKNICSNYFHSSIEILKSLTTQGRIGRVSPSRCSRISHITPLLFMTISLLLQQVHLIGVQLESLV